ncbi:MAG: hypothetical protein ACI8PZ_001673 [Myxococcota bacterium]|jgi:hypothetical protein
MLLPIVFSLLMLTALGLALLPWPHAADPTPVPVRRRPSR